MYNLDIYIFYFSHLFSSLIKLEFLDLKDNRVTYVNTSAFMELHSLKAVNMTNNMLTFENRGLSNKLSPLYNCHKLEDVQLANNSLIKIFADWRYFEVLETLNLAYNNISKIQVTNNTENFIASFLNSVYFYRIR